MRAITIAFALLLITSACFADTIVLKDGRRLQGKVVARSSSKIAIKTDAGELVTLKRDEVAEVLEDGPGASQQRAARPRPGEPSASGKRRWQKRWVYMHVNLYTNESLAKAEDVLRRAKSAGYTGVLYNDGKVLTWWKMNLKPWVRNVSQFRELTRQLGLELVVGVFTFGYSNAFLWHDPNLAAGMPIRDAPLIAREGQLAPVQTATIENGSFEQYTGQRATGYALQDHPGKGSFIDTDIVKHGRTSLRFEDVGTVDGRGHGRVSQKVDVTPWQQYRIRVWMKTEKLSATSFRIVVLGHRRALQYQDLLVKDGARTRHVRHPRNLTTDWIEQSVTFNSLDNTNVRIYLGMWGGKAGRIWWDDLRIDSVPTLNLLRRESLPLVIRGQDGLVYEGGRDFEQVKDPLLRHAGKYDTRHAPPVIKLTRRSRIREGQVVSFSGYHASLTLMGFVSASLYEPKVFELCRQQIQKSEELLAPDGYFMIHHELRCAGWEPDAVRRFDTSGELLAFNIRRCCEIARRESGGKPLYVFSDMFDPNHNACADYYLVNNTLEGSWKGLDSGVIVMPWEAEKHGRPALESFAKRVHRQMICAYRDRDVAADYRMWIEAAKGVPNIIGVMYYSARHEYRDLEEFAEVWWGGRRP